MAMFVLKHRLNSVHIVVYYCSLCICGWRTCWAEVSKYDYCRSEVCIFLLDNIWKYLSIFPLFFLFSSTEHAHRWISLFSEWEFWTVIDLDLSVLCHGITPNTTLRRKNNTQSLLSGPSGSNSHPILLGPAFLNNFSVKNHYYWMIIV